VAVVRAFEIEGFKIWFWSDDHDPPHFHVKKSGEWEVKVRFLRDPEQMIEVEWVVKRPASSTLKAICELTEQYRVELLDQWDEIHRN
jgi:hypothetical protein